jgi:hypothetical protein
MMLSTSFKCSPISVPLWRCNCSATRARHRARPARALPCPSCLLRLLQPEDRLALGEGDPHRLPDRVRLFARERENVGQESVDALVCPGWPGLPLASPPGRFAVQQAARKQSSHEKRASGVR